MDACPIEIGLGGRRADVNMDSVHREGGKELGQPVFERRRHPIGVGIEQQTGELD